MDSCIWEHQKDYKPDGNLLPFDYDVAKIERLLKVSEIMHL